MMEVAVTLQMTEDELLAIRRTGEIVVRVVGEPSVVKVVVTVVNRVLVEVLVSVPVIGLRPVSTPDVDSVPLCEKETLEPVCAGEENALGAVRVCTPLNDPSEVVNVCIDVRELELPAV